MLLLLYYSFPSWSVQAEIVKKVKSLFNIIFGRTVQLVEVMAPQPGTEPQPQWWKH